MRSNTNLENGAQWIVKQFIYLFIHNPRSAQFSMEKNWSSSLYELVLYTLRPSLPGPAKAPPTGLVREKGITCFLNNFVEYKEINCVLIYDALDNLEIFMNKRWF